MRKDSEKTSMRENVGDLEGSIEDLASERKKRKPRKAWIVGGVILGMLIIVGVGMFVWHEQPSFCGALCHDVMGDYVEGYESVDSNLLITTHARANQDCLGCHEPTINQQVGEFFTYVSGDYSVPLEKSGIGTREFCMTAGCHDNWDAIVEATSNWPGTETVYNPKGIYNPHENHRGDSDCGDCHQIHRPSELHCAECHNIEVPDGWLGYE